MQDTSVLSHVVCSSVIGYVAVINANRCVLKWHKCKKQQKKLPDICIGKCSHNGHDEPVLTSCGRDILEGLK